MLSIMSRTETPTESPTESPTEAPTESPTEAPTKAPTESPTESPTEAPIEQDAGVVETTMTVTNEFKKIQASNEQEEKAQIKEVDAKAQIRMHTYPYMITNNSNVCTTIGVASNSTSRARNDCVNLARGRPATMSNNQYAAAKAVDGSTFDSDHTRCRHVLPPTRNTCHH